MNQISKKYRSLATKVAIIALAPLAGVSFAAIAHADLTPTTALTLGAPTGVQSAALPFTGVKAATFTTPATMQNLVVSPSQGVVGTPVTVTGSNLPANAQVQLTWSTADGNWIVDVQPSTVNYLGNSFTKYAVNMATVSTDATGSFTYAFKAPSDFGGSHDIYAVSSGLALAHGGFQQVRTFTMSPTSGPVGTPITITYTGMGASLYAAGASVMWDNHYAGEIQAQWTRGTATFQIRAAGPRGAHFVQVEDAINFSYLNIIQSPIPYANSGEGVFTVTRDAGLLPASVEFPTKVTPSVSARTTVVTTGVDANSKAVANLSVSEGPILTKTVLSVKGLSTTGEHRLVYSTVVGNRVNCTGQCWSFNPLPLGTVNVTDGTVNQEVTIPDNLGGFHVIQVMKGEVIEAQVPFYVKESIVPFYDANGKLLSMGTAKYDPIITPTSAAKGQSGEGATTFKQGEDFTVSIKGVGWTQMDNTLAVTYDNSYIGYGCGFNSNGYMVIHLKATGAPGTHIIDLHPLLYTNQPSFANTPYGMVPVLTSANDFAGLAIGYQVPTIHLSIKVTK